MAVRRWWRGFGEGSNKARSGPPTEQKMSLSITSTGVQKVANLPDTGAGALVAAYRHNQLVRACVDILANSATDPRLIVQARDKDGDWNEVMGHPFRRLLMRPNSYMDEAMFISFAEMSIEVMGVFYCEIVRSRGKVPVELHPLQPQLVTPQYRTLRNGEKELTHYLYKDGLYEQKFALEEMLVRDDKMLGGRLSPLASAMRAIDSDNAQTDYVRAFFGNAGVPSGLLKIHNRTIDQDESRRLQDQWDARYSLAGGGANGTAVLDENADYQKIGANLNELDSQTLRGFDESRITMAFGVPPLIVYAYFGLMRATYSNLKEAWSQFWQTTMSSKLKGWRSFFTVNLLPAFEDQNAILNEQTRLFWDISQVGALQENVDAANDRARNNFTAGGMTLNEFRAAVGLRDFPEPDLGDMIYFQLRAASGLSGMSPLAALSDAQTEADVAKILSEGFARLELAQGGAREGGSTAVQTTPSASKWQLVRPQDAKMRQAEQQRLKQYGDELYALADKARQGQIDKEQFVIDLKALSRDSLVAAYVLGMLLGDDELTDEEFASVYTHIQKAEESAANLGEDIYAGRYGGVHRDEEDEGQPASLTARTALWVGAAAAVIVLGRTWRRDDPELMWRRGATEEPCNDCLAFEGTTMKASVWRATWDAERLPRGHGLECGGWNCECDLYVVA